MEDGKYIMVHKMWLEFMYSYPSNLNHHLEFQVAARTDSSSTKSMKDLALHLKVRLERCVMPIWTRGTHTGVGLPP